MITLKLFIWVAFIAIDVWINYRIIEVNDARPNYLLLNIIRGGAFILYGAFVWDFQNQVWYWNIFVYSVASFWLLFDLALNIARKKPLHIGQNSGYIDQFGFKNPGIYYFGKVCALALLTFSIINIYNP